jgi:hypothetical protein
MASEGKELSEALHEAFEKHPELTVKAFDQVIGESAAVNTALRRDLAAANATIEALQADLAGTAELLLREQALAESRALALATMREAIGPLAALIPELEAYETECREKGREPWHRYPFDVSVRCDEIQDVRAALAQSDDAAAALAGVVLEAGDRMAEKFGHAATAVEKRCLVEHRGCYSEQAMVDAMRETIDAYRRARAALRGGGAAGSL